MQLAAAGGIEPAHQEGRGGGGMAGGDTKVCVYWHLQCLSVGQEGADSQGQTLSMAEEWGWPGEMAPGSRTRG